MPSSHITSKQIDGETMETVTDFIFLGSKITADDDCGQEIKRHLLLGKKAMTNPDMPIELMMPSNHLILCCPLLFLPSIFPTSESFPFKQTPGDSEG